MCHPDAFAIVGHLQGGERLGEQIRPRCRIENRHEQYPVTGPVKHMQVQLPHLLRASAPGKLMGERAGGGSINRLAVGPQPCPHFLQPIEFRRRDDAVGGGADVEQFIAALADNIDQEWRNSMPQGLKFVSADLYPQVSLIVMHDSQSRPTSPLGGIICSGVSKSPIPNADYVAPSVRIMRDSWSRWQVDC